MTILSKHGPHDVVYLLDVSYEGLYAKLKEVLSQEELRLFAIPGRRTTEHFWFTEKEVAFKPFTRASQEEQNEAAIQLEVKKAAILQKLFTYPELTKYAEQLFRTPTESELLIVEDATTSKPYITLVQWGCRLARGDKQVNPLEKIINWPRPDHDQVTLELIHTDGEPIANAPFTVKYKSRNNPFTSNNKGEIALGRVKHGEEIFVWEGHAENGPETQSFEVVPGQEHYTLIFIYYHRFSIRVTDQEGQALPDIAIELAHADTKNSYRSGDDGIIWITDLALQKGHDIITLAEKGKRETAREYGFNRQTQELHFMIERTQYGHFTIQVLDKEDGQPVENYPLQLEYDGQSSTHQSGKNGQLIPAALPVGTEMTVIDGNNKHNNIIYTIKQGENTLIFRVKRPQPEIITVRLVNGKNDPIPDVPISFTMVGQTYHSTTNNQGECQVKRGIPDSEKYFTAQFALKTKHGKEKNYTRKVKFVSGQMDYTIKIKPFNWRWLLLLLLLLPLLLLIEFNKDVRVQTLKADTKMAVSNTDVHLAYIRYALYDKGRFFVADTIALQEITDSSGLATFNSLNYTLYSWVFHNLFRADVWTELACYEAEDANPRFHWVSGNDIIQLLLIDKIIALDFLVVDADDGEPLPDAGVIVYTDQSIIDSTLTGIDGKALFKRFPKCSPISIVSGHLDGYYPDTLKNVQITQYDGGQLTKRTLRLKPIKKKITFFVTDCRNGEPLPGARATITIEETTSNKSQSHRTNINGVGKGEYDDLHITKKLRIEVEKKYYKSGKMDKNISVGEFIKLPDSYRTICLEPLSNTIDFQNIDSLTQKPLAGVTNVVTVASPSGNRKDTIFSNKNGVFSIPDIEVGDKITIVATLDPTYYPNRHTIKEKDAQALLDDNAQQRIIPLTPVAPPCNTSSSGDSGKDYYLEEYNMGQSHGKFFFEYYTDSEPDMISVYCAKKQDISPANRIFGPVSSKVHTAEWIQLRCDIITVEVIGDTNWEYTVNCPN